MRYWQPAKGLLSARVIVICRLSFFSTFALYIFASKYFRRTKVSIVNGLDKKLNIHIVGASGSGVTTLGKALSDELHVPYFDSDDFYWLPSQPPYTIKRDPAERVELIEKALDGRAGWILGGSLLTWGETFMDRFDLVIFLYIPWHIRMERLKKREYDRYGDIIFNDQQRNVLYNAFINWAAGYDNDETKGRTLSAHKNWLKKLSCQVLEISGGYTTAQRIAIIIDAIK